MNIEEIIVSIKLLPLPTIVEKYHLSWMDLKDVLGEYNFEGFTDYERIDIRAPYFVPEEKAYIWGFLKASELASRKLFELVPVKEVHDACELRFEAFKEMLNNYITERIQQTYEAVPLSKMTREAVRQSIVYSGKSGHRIRKIAATCSGNM